MQRHLDLFRTLFTAAVRTSRLPILIGMRTHRTRRLTWNHQYRKMKMGSTPVSRKTRKLEQPALRISAQAKGPNDRVDRDCSGYP